MRRIISRLTIMAGTAMLAVIFTASPLRAETLTPENQVISLRHIVEQTDDPSQRASALQLLANAGTYQALAFAQTLLGDASKQTAEAAAQAVWTILKAHPDYNGTESRQMLHRALPLLSSKERKQATAWLKAQSDTQEGYVCLFNGRDLTGWKGLVENPIARGKMSAQQMAEAQQKADDLMRRDWLVEDGSLVYVGHGWDNICTVGQYADFELLVDWKLDPAGKEPDAGVYLRGTPQVQIWDIRRTDVGAQVGSGGLYNNQKHPSTPSSVEDNKLGEWNTFRIIMQGERVTVWLNGVKVVDNVVLENYWDRSLPIFPSEQIEMQAHGSRCSFRNIYVKRL